MLFGGCCAAYCCGLPASPPTPRPAIHVQGLVYCALQAELNAKYAVLTDDHASLQSSYGSLQVCKPNSPGVLLAPHAKICFPAKVDRHAPLLHPLHCRAS